MATVTFWYSRFLCPQKASSAAEAGKVGRVWTQLWADSSADSGPGCAHSEPNSGIAEKPGDLPSFLGDFATLPNGA